MQQLSSLPLGVILGSAAAVSMSYVLLTAFKPSPRITLEQIKTAGAQPFVPKSQRLLEYFIHGKPSGKTVILAIHGAQTTGNLFSILHRWALDNDVTIVAPTLPGFGLTPYVAYSLAEWVADVQDLISSLQVTRFHVLGTSLGSIHAAALASLYQPRDAIGNVELYVAFAPEAKDHDPLQGSVLKMFGTLRNSPWTKRLLEKLLFMPLLRTFTPRASDVSRSIRHQWEGAASCTDIIYMPWHFEWQTLAKDRRVIIVSGKQDNVAPPHNQKLLHKLIEGSQLVEYDGPHEQSIKEPALMASHLMLLL